MRLIKSLFTSARRLGLAWLGAGLLLGLGITAAAWLNLPAPRLAAQTVGLRGPLTLVFSEPMQSASVAQRLSLEPSVPGHWTWDEAAGGRSISFWPSSPLPAGQTYTLRLQAGVKAKNGRLMLRGQSWAVTIRRPAVIYLGPSQAPDLWRVSADGQDRVQLTTTGGKVFDYGVSPDGQWIAYSVRNQQQGLDLWEIDRNGANPRLLLPCGADWCINPAYGPNGGRIAYSRRKASGVPGSAPGLARLWLLDRATLATDSLYMDPNTGGAQPSWSPDGQYLAVVDEGAPGVRVLGLQDKTEFLLPAGEGAALAWSPDGQALYYTVSTGGEELPAISVYAVDVRTRQPRLILGSPVGASVADAAGFLDYSVPAISPDGTWLADASRQVLGSPAKQLWLLKLDSSRMPQQLDDSRRQAITDDPLSNAASYHWSPLGGQLVFQRLSLGASDLRPQVVVWDQADNSSRVLAEDGFQPDWVP